MFLKKFSKAVGQFLLSAFLAAMLATGVDIILFLTGGFLRGRYYLVLFALLSVGFWCLCFFLKKTKVVAKALAGTVAIAAALYFAWLPFHSWGAYEPVDSGKADFYGGKRIMLIVPHQDDEINVLGGAIEQYAAYGSEVYIVFTTNGDSFYSASTRLNEAILSSQLMGVPEDHLIFLGYGDGWQNYATHLYNGEEGTVISSYCGNTATYGLEDHPAYHEGNAYTFENYLKDMQSVVADYRPDVIYCVDYDAHDDHRATSLLFEKAMGRILREYPDYRPTVFKGYGYNTAWGAEQDYCALNIGATGDVFCSDFAQKPQVYRWEDRVRLPVAASALSRSLSGSNIFRALAAHACQDAETHAVSVANGDKVVWERRTDSLCYDATIEASSGNPELLSDFMVYDNSDLYGGRDQIDGIWIPDDREKCFTVTFPENRSVESIVLYDHPYEDQNILNAVIELEDGTRIETGPLHPGGAANSFPMNAQIQTFTVTLLEWEGELAGLGEVEAFGAATTSVGSLLKMMDMENDFAYDYILDESGFGRFCFYTYGDLPEVDADHYTVASSNEACSVTLEDGVLMVDCPKGQSCTITVTCKDAPVSDTILVRNPGSATRIWADAFQRLEEAYLMRGYKNIPLYQIGIKVVDKVVHSLTH